MAVFEYSRDIRIWTKTCPRCKNAYKGTEHQHQSEKIFMGIFGRADRHADGMQAFCKQCAKER